MTVLVCVVKFVHFHWDISSIQTSKCHVYSIRWRYVTWCNTWLSSSPFIWKRRLLQFHVLLQYSHILSKSPCLYLYISPRSPPFFCRTTPNHLHFAQNAQTISICNASPHQSHFEYPEDCTSRHRAILSFNDTPCIHSTIIHSTLSSADFQHSLPMCQSHMSTHLMNLLSTTHDRRTFMVSKVGFCGRGIHLTHRQHCINMWNFTVIATWCLLDTTITRTTKIINGCL